MSERTYGGRTIANIMDAAQQSIHVDAAHMLIAPRAMLDLLTRIAELEAENTRGDALLRAVGTINAACTAKGGAGSTVLDEKFIARELEWGEVQYGPLEPALLALSLAAQLQEG